MGMPEAARLLAQDIGSAIGYAWLAVVAYAALRAYMACR